MVPATNQHIGSKGLATGMSFFPLAQDDYLLEPYGFGMLQAEDPQSTN
jgi:hypothetical protein